jgi:hypothetical protein
MQLGAGDYEVRAGSADRIVIEWTVKNEATVAKVKTNSTWWATPRNWRHPASHNDSHAVIEVPHETDLVIRLAAGDMRIRGILGNRGVASHAGDLNLFCDTCHSFTLGLTIRRKRHHQNANTERLRRLGGFQQIRGPIRMLFFRRFDLRFRPRIPAGRCLLPQPPEDLRIH